MRHIVTIECEDDAGHRYLVDEYQDEIPVDDLATGMREIIPGMTTSKLRGGGNVDFIDEDTFEIVRTGAKIRRLR